MSMTHHRKYDSSQAQLTIHTMVTLALGVLLLVATAVADDVGTPDDAEADVEPERVLVAVVKMTLRRGAEEDTFEATVSFDLMS